MPNWCEGTLKVRGKVKDLKKFVLEGLKPVDFFGNYLESLKINQYDNCESDETCYIENTRRGFVKGLDVYFEEDDEEIQIIHLDTKFAWGIEPKQLQETCIKYNIDMKIYAFECGMQFNQDIEIVNGEIIKDEEINFKDKDYRWDCIMPNLGG